MVLKKFNLIKIKAFYNSNNKLLLKLKILRDQDAFLISTYIGKKSLYIISSIGFIKGVLLTTCTLEQDNDNLNGWHFYDKIIEVIKLHFENIVFWNRKCSLHLYTTLRRLARNISDLNELVGFYEKWENHGFSVWAKF